MSRGQNPRKGTALFLALATLFTVVALANMILSFVQSQSRLTHHQVSRVQAFYAAQAAMNYAIEMLRAGTWNAGVDCTPEDYGCDVSSAIGLANYSPASIKSITVKILPKGRNPSEIDPSTSEPYGSGISISETSPVIVTIDYQYTSS